eukprot:5731392-Prymnesium_polylepis.1
MPWRFSSVVSRCGRMRSWQGSSEISSATLRARVRATIVDSEAGGAAGRLWQQNTGFGRRVGGLQAPGARGPVDGTVRYGTVTPTPSMEHRASTRQNAHQ